MVELLVAMGILIFLAILLASAVTSLRERASTLGCASNLRQLMSAVQRYVADHDGYMPWIEPNQGKLDGYEAGDGINTHTVNVALGVKGYFDEMSQCLQCPGWTNWRKNGGAHNGARMRLPINSGNGGSVNSIRNTYEWRNLTPVGYNAPSGKWATVPKVKINTINEPSKEWYICDSAPGAVYNLPPSTYSHGKQGGFAAYVDGHVAWLRMPNQWTVNQAYNNLPFEIPGQFRRN
jgi:type II secretory pathway pseudopilin PulG